MTKFAAFRSVSSFAELPKLLAALVATRPDDGDERFSPEIEHMQDDDGAERFTRGDLSGHYAETLEADPFEASFGDPLPLTIIEPGEEPDEHYMPTPFEAQAECGGIIATIFDLFTDTRLDPLAPEIAWGFVNSFHFVAGKLANREDGLERVILDMARRMDASEVFNSELEQKQLECQSVAEQRAAIEAMRDYAAAMYRACSGRAWTPAKGSKASHVTSASQIAALDFLRARAEKRRDRYDPQGPTVVISGPPDWHDWQIIYDQLSAIRARIPNMVLVSIGGRKGVPAIAAAWAAREQVPCVVFGLYGRGKSAAFDRNRQVNKTQPVEAVICEGSGIQSHLYDLFNPQDGGRRVPTHVIMRADQAPCPPLPKSRRLAA
ncbi:roadblock/LC7 domain-containing protein [Sphingopyxis panaciterrulae]|uniref:Roadblock/LC7 domain-containing protein n=2 Tax=Sphingopyxis panaciterrulae TaxID=462372 RepID=A0A7W9ERA2_9SPHN|nr:SLOG family protein [Sphingopyxis panaciterrulae]MBB5707339.1 roadblock/LC7 domain-containing protein [Sphingopyxis panaciterrulae]